MSTGRTAVARSAARLGAVQALYQMDLTGADISAVLADFSSERLGEQFENGQCGGADVKFLEAIVRGVVEEQHKIDRALEGCLAKGWTLGRLDSTLRAILRSAGFELLFRDDVPEKVVISEYVDVAHAFFDRPEPAFINGALDALAKTARGRGEA